MRPRYLSLSMGCTAGLISLLGCGTGMVEGPLTAVEAPVFLPPAAEHVGPLEVSIQTSTSGATIYYTIGASPEEPTESSAVYTGPLTVSATTTIAAKAFKAGMSPSALAQASYTIVTDCTPACTCELTAGQSCKASCASSESEVADTCPAGAVCCRPMETAATPMFSPGGGTYSATQVVAITTATDGATIQYTLDGTTPNESSPAYSSPIAVFSTTTIKARAFKAGMGPSETASATYTISAVSGPRAFPEAQGGGAESIGGRGGRIIHVTTVESEGPGSLREAMESSGPRIVVFDVGGIIHLQRTAANPDGFIYVTEPYLTVAGQTAPGGGITVHGIIQFQAHDVILRFISIRLGDATNNTYLYGLGLDFGGNSSSNVIVDHLSISWAHDDTVQFWGTKRVEKYTISWNLIAEGLRDPLAKSSQAMMFGGETLEALQSGDFDIHHNALMKFADRFPTAKIKDLRITNNLMYYALWEMTTLFGGVEADIVGNIYKRIPEKKYEVKVYENPTGIIDQGVLGSPSIFIAENKGQHQENPDNDNWPMVDGGDTHPSWKRLTPLPPPKYPVTVHSTAVLEQLVLDDVGNSRRLDENGNWVSRRDAVDARLVNEYTTNTGIQPEQTSNSVPWDASVVGGWPTIDEGTPYEDTDRDGMPNAWELSHDLDPNNPSDANGDSDGDGYTNIEEFLNGKTT